jgi:hypothetical protein
MPSLTLIIKVPETLAIVFGIFWFKIVKKSRSRVPWNGILGNKVA